MTPEDEMRELLGHAGPDDAATERDWETFLNTAHRSLAMRRSLLVAGAVVLIGIGVAAGATLMDGPVGAPEPIAPAGSNEPTEAPTAEEPGEPEVDVQADYAYPAPDADPASVVQVWFLKGEQLAPTYRDVQGAEGIGRAALESLLAGPDGAEERDGLASVMPEGSDLLGLTIAKGVATVDFSSEFNSTGLGTCCEHLPLAQVVWTLAQFDTVDKVIFEIEGDRVVSYGGHGLALDRPQTRKNSENNAPPIVVDAPFPGQSVDSTFTLEGDANVFEANVTWRVVDPDGAVLSEGFATATCGTGCRGDYEVDVTVDVTGPTEAVLEVFESSAEDGSPLHMVRVPITITT